MTNATLEICRAVVFLVAVAATLPLSARADEAGAAPEDWSIHGQATFLWQGYPNFPAEFSGPNSLQKLAQGRETFDATLFLGVRLLDDLAFYVDPEVDQGFGLENTLGVAGFTSGEAYKVGSNAPYGRIPRAYFRYVVGLGGDAVTDAPDANQLGGSHLSDNVTITLGKFSVTDMFDTNKYAHDPRSDFFNWAMVDSGAFDYPADAWGYTYGAAIEWTQSRWTLRAGLFDLSREPNTKALVRGFGQFSVVTEAEERHELWGQPGAVKFLFFANRARMGSYADALALAQQTGTTPNTADVRRYATRPGGAINVQQQILPDLGAFLRASMNDGSEEAYEFTDINRSLAVGLSLKGTAWDRPADTVGIAGVINGLSSAAADYIAAGGLGILIGDGALPRYGLEKISEFYYSVTVTEGAVLTLDYQFVDHPGYNPLRGPVDVFGVRAHVEF
jgi:high affinity Mn2+ porin